MALNAEKQAREVLGEDKKESLEWYLRMGETLFELKAYSQAKEWLGKAKNFKKADDYWRVAWCFAKVYEEEKNPKKAIQNLEVSKKKMEEKSFRENHPKEWNGMLDLLWSLYDSLGRYEDAITFLTILLGGEFKGEVKIIAKAMMVMNGDVNQHDFKRGIRLVSATDSDGQESPLTQLLLYSADSERFHERFTLAFQDELGLILRGYHDAITAAKDDLIKVAQLRYFFGRALFYNGKKKEALIVWEDNIFGLTDLKSGDRNTVSFRARSAEKLMSGYAQFVKVGPRSEAGEYVRKAEKLKAWFDDAHGDDDHDITLLMCRVYMLNAQYHDAKKCMHGWIKRALNLLTDSSDENDWQGFLKLARALVRLGDEHNAVAAWMLITNVPESHWEMSCDGRCGHEWPGIVEGKEPYMCLDCGDVIFEEDCRRKLEKGELKRRVCGKDHELLRLPKMDAKAKRRIDNRIARIQGLEMPVEDWVEGVRKLYVARRSDAPMQNRESKRRMGMRPKFRGLRRLAYP